MMNLLYNYINIYISEDANLEAEVDLLLNSGTSDNEEDQKEIRNYLSIEDYLVRSCLTLSWIFHR